MEVKPLPMTAIVPDAVAQTNAHFFSAQQMATLRRLSEILMPPLKGYRGVRLVEGLAGIERELKRGRIERPALWGLELQ